MPREKKLVGQALIGAATFALFFWMGVVRKWEPFYTYYYFFAWAPFLWVLDRGVALRTGKGCFPNVGSTLWLLSSSTTIWLIFEALNFRLKNWTYHGLPREIWIHWPGYAFSFATVLPGIFFVEKWLETFRKHPRGMHPAAQERDEVPSWPLIIGTAMLTLPLALPQYFFPLVWGGFFFLLEPLVWRWGGNSLLKGWYEGRWNKTLLLLVSGLLCGLFWETCNFGAGAKWKYHVPFVGFGKIFEMPFIGFLGFPPFAVEAHTMFETGTLIKNRLSKPARILWAMLLLILWFLIFMGMDRFTVRDWKSPEKLMTAVV